MIQIHRLRPAALTLLVGIILTFLLCWIEAAAHADPIAAPPPATTGVDWRLYLALGLAAFAGVKAIVDALLAFFRVEAPLTATTIDDMIRDDLQLAHDKLDALTAIVGRVVPGAALAPAPVPVTMPIPRGPEAGKVAPYLIIWFGALAVTIGLLLIFGACTAAQRTALGHAAIDCAETQARADAVSVLVPVVSSIIVSASSPDGRSIDTSTVKSALTRANVLTEAGILLTCAAKQAFAILTTPAPAAVGAPAAAALVLDPAAVARADAEVMTAIAPGVAVTVGTVR